MNKQITLFQKHINKNEKVLIRYYFPTKQISVDTYYVDSKKYSKNRDKAHPNYGKNWYKQRINLHPNYTSELYQRQLELHSNLNKNRYQKYKQLHLKHIAKRKRELGYIEIANNIIQDIDIEINYHHINNMLVIPIPKQIHMSNLSKRERHRSLIDEHWISEFYPINNIIKRCM